MAGSDGDRAARETFAYVIVRFSVEVQREAFGKKSAEALPGGAVKFMNGWGESGLLNALAHALTAEMAADAAVKIVDNGRIRCLRMRLLQELLHFHAAGLGHRRLMRHDASRLRDGNDEQGIEAGLSFEAIVPAAKLAERADAKLRHVAANFFSE